MDPRVARSRAAVLDATLGLLCEEGAEGFSVDAVARRSGVARTTIYRHWPDASELLADAIGTVSVPAVDVDRGSLRDELVGLYTQLARNLRGSDLGRILPVLLELARRDPSLRPLHRRVVRERRRPAILAVRRAVARGELPAGTDAERLVDRIAGPVFYRFLVVRDPYRPIDVERLVDEVLAAAAR